MTLRDYILKLEQIAFDEGDLIEVHTTDGTGRRLPAPSPRVQARMPMCFKGGRLTPAWPYMPRKEFLAIVGSVENTEAKLLQARKEAQSLWLLVKDEFYTKAGTERKTLPSTNALKTRDQVEFLQNEIRRLENLAYSQKKAIENPWSHVQISYLVQWAPLYYQGWEGPIEIMFTPNPLGVALIDFQCTNEKS